MHEGIIGAYPGNGYFIDSTPRLDIGIIIDKDDDYLIVANTGTRRTPKASMSQWSAMQPAMFRRQMYTVDKIPLIMKTPIRSGWNP